MGKLYFIQKAFSLPRHKTQHFIGHLYNIISIGWMYKKREVCENKNNYNDEVLSLSAVKINRLFLEEIKQSFCLAGQKYSYPNSYW